MKSQSESKSNVNTRGLPIPFSRPWTGRDYEDHYELAFVYVRRNREAGHTTRLKQLVEYVYDTDYSNTEYQRIRRFVNQSDYFKTKTSGKYTEIEPTLAVFGLPLETDVSVSQKQQTATGLEKDATEDNISDNLDSETPEDTTESYPKDRSKALLDKILRINPDDHGDYRHDILTQLGTYRNNISGTYSILEHRVREQYLGIPNTTRFTDSHDASNSQRRFRDALDNASEAFDHGVVLTLTIDPKRFETHTDATEAIIEARQNLLQTLDYQVGGYPTQITIPDFQTKTGLLHYHIPLFGIRNVPESQNETGQPTISESQIQQYWSEDYDIGSQISTQPIQRGRNGTWLLHRDDKKVSLGYYLGKRIRELQDLAGLETGSMPLKFWRHALFWTYGIQYVSCSESLKDATEDSDTGLSGLPKTTEWTYVGTARYDQIPSQIRDNMILVGSRG
jgi:hypothetical protein